MDPLTQAVSNTWEISFRDLKALLQDIPTTDLRQIEVDKITRGADGTQEISLGIL